MTERIVKPHASRTRASLFLLCVSAALLNCAGDGEGPSTEEDTSSGGTSSGEMLSGGTSSGGTLSATGGSTPEPNASGGAVLSSTGGAEASGGSRELPEASGGASPEVEPPCSQTCADDCFALGGEVVSGLCEGAEQECCWMGAPSDPYAPEDPASTPHPETVPVAELEAIEEMPDPLTLMDGTKVTTTEQWHVRRKEMVRLLEDYTYGHMPPPPGNTTAEVVSEAEPGGGGSYSYKLVHLSFGPDEDLGFDLGLFVPSEGEGPYPVLISLSFDAGASSLGGASAAISRGFAVATVPYQQLAQDSGSWQSSPFFMAYPDYDWRDIAAWSWGMSRAVDYLATDSDFDRDKIMVTGVSRLGQAALLMGALDQRIALSIPMAGGMAFRHSGAEMGEGLGQGITEVVDQVTYWFGPRLPDFRNKTPLLPSDQHWLPALTAPRLFIMTNSLADPYGRAYAAAQSYLGAKPVYEFLEVPDNLGQFFRPGGHGATADDWSAAMDFADQYLMGLPGDRRFDVLPPAGDLP